MLITLLLACTPARMTGVFYTDTGEQSINGLPDCEQSAYVQLPDTNDGTINHDHWSWSEIRLFVYGDENIPLGFAGFFPIVDSTVSGEVDTNDGDGVSVYYNLDDYVTGDATPYTVVCPAS